VSANTSTEPGRAFLAIHLIGCGVTWGSSYLFMKMVAGDIAPAVIASVRAVGATFALIAALLIIGQSILPRGREWKDWLVLGTLNGWAPNILVAFALARMDSGPTVMIQASGPLMTAILAHFLLTSERLTPVKLIGILVGLAGISLIIGPTAFSGEGTALAVGAMLLLTFGYASGNIYTRIIPNAAPIRLALGQQAVSAVFATAIALLYAGPASYAPVRDHALVMLALSIFSTALPIWIFMRLITRAGSAKAAMTSYLVPAVAFFLGITVLGEPLVFRQLLGGIIVLLSVAIVTGLLRLPTGRTT
jgi:drug/metabolite transporter (DMT)-like permease